MQELHEGALLSPRLLRSLAFVDGAGVKGTSFGLKIDLGVDIGPRRTFTAKSVVLLTRRSMRIGNSAGVARSS
jgi:hypothetical protein